MSEKKTKLVEITNLGVDCTEMKFTHKCTVCDCEYKFCLDAVNVTRYGGEKTKMWILCPRCSESSTVDVGKYEPLLKKRENYTPERDD